MFTRELVLAPQVVHVEFALAPAINALNSLHLTGQVERLSGLGDWVVRTASAFTPAERSIELVVSDALALSVNDALPMDQYPDFPAFLRDWNAADPVDLRDRLFDYVLRLPAIYPKCWTTDAPVPGADDALSSLDAYTAFMRNFDESAATSEAIFAEAYRLLRHPERLQREVAAFLTHLWEIGGLRDEWTRAEPMLIESVAAFQKQAYRNLTAIEAIRVVTGRDMSGFDDWQQTNIDRVLFIPSPHMGPYIAGMVRGSTFTILFGARPPKGASAASPELSRAELLIRLNALADDTRLHILELLTRHDELCAQEIIERLDLSQSSASRHLSQLSAAGFLTERRREVNKCYSLNHERAADVVRALRSFLTRH